MAVFRVEKTRDYTVMSNHALKNIHLSLKAKGLLSIMLSLPEEWDYTLKGLARICMEGVDSIRKAIQELEAEGYIVRSRVRNEKGQLTDAEYVIYERPVHNPPMQAEPVNEQPTQPEPMQEPPMRAEPTQAQPTQEKPMLENPILDMPVLENPMQLNIYNKLNTYSSSTYISNPILSRPDDRRRLDGTVLRERYRSVILGNIEYNVLCQREDRERLDEIVELMLDTVCTTKQSVRIAGDDYPVNIVRDRLLKITSTHIEYLFEAMKNTATYVRNIKKYLLAALFNAPATIGNYYSAMVNHDLYGSCAKVIP